MWELGNIIVEPFSVECLTVKKVVQVSGKYALYVLDTNTLSDTYSTIEELQARYTSPDVEVYANMNEYLECIFGHKRKLWKVGAVIIPGENNSHAYLLTQISNAHLLTLLNLTADMAPITEYKLIDIRTGMQFGDSQDSIRKLIHKYPNAKVYSDITQYMREYL